MMNVVSMVPRQRAAILVAAGDVFARWGFTAASMQDIARRARLSEAWVQLHFGSKRDLFDAWVDQAWASALARLEAAVGEARSPEAKLQTFIHLRQGQAERMLRDSRITLEALRDILPLLEQRLAAPRAREVALLESIFEEGRVEGSFAFTVRGPRTAARALAVGLQDIECAMVRFLAASAQPAQSPDPSAR
ncbi:TetR/AcrR family transcriptional regulator [Myxococcus sp. Y35]|uniref:TetR/AcrR family transcriptional regulator n=1 Tax=Pseudomyxococcus flavus TaxID=3115648 RepID=UPI003CE9A926